jgi:carboxyl-terminal processing protease
VRPTASPIDMTNFLLHRTLLVVFCLTLSLLTVPWPAVARDLSFEANRAKVLSYLLREQLARNHYSHKSLDDELSVAAFELYLKQLDGQKRFLLQRDVDRLRVHATRIDDEMSRGQFELPQLGADILRERVARAAQLVEEILAGEFNFTRQETFEADPAKLAFCATEMELRERWRQVLKYQVLNRYLNLLEDEGAAPGKVKEAELLAKARERTLKGNRDFFARILEETVQDHFDRYFDAVARAFDPHSGYLPPAQKEDFDIGMRGSLEGIGATLREEDGYIKVVSIIPGSPSARQGQLQAEDVILMVAQADGEPVDVTDTRLREAVSLIRGAKGTEVRLTVRKPDGTRLVIPIVRDVVQIEETFVKSAVLSDEKSQRAYGYVKIPSFYRDFQKTRTGEKARNVTDDLLAELNKLKGRKIDGLILDLRNNGGGALSDAVAVTGLFIEKGPVVQVKSSDGQMDILTDNDPSIAYNGPLVVLVNQFSASASEIVAGALQDYGRAIIIGSEHTHGKGTVQAVADLDRTLPFPNMRQYEPLGAMRVTIQKFYRVSGGSTQFRGVVPDIILPDRLGHLKSGEQYLDHSLPWDTVAATDYAPWSQLQAKSELKAKSARRVATEETFIAISRDGARAKERMENTRQSLNIEDIRRERQEAKKLQKEMPGWHDEEAATAGKEKNPVGAEEKRRLWLLEVNEDPYTREAMAILEDLAGVVPAIAQPASSPEANRSSYSRPRPR